MHIGLCEQSEFSDSVEVVLVSLKNITATALMQIPNKCIRNYNINNYYSDLTQSRTHFGRIVGNREINYVFTFIVLTKLTVQDRATILNIQYWLP